MTNHTSRRDFLTAAAATLLAASLEAAPAKSAYGIAWTSFPVRSRQGKTRPALPAEDFINLCHSFGASGCQMDANQLASTDGEYLKRVRRLLDEKGMYLELAFSARALEDAEAFARVAETARQLGVTQLRTACLGGRRYEDFREPGKWQEFSNHWKQALPKAVPLLEQHQLTVGVENHKDWLADELAEILRRAGSRYLGACVDFGNNISFLEEPMAVVEKLAPYVVSTHLKDMAYREYEQGLLLSEVPLGDGVLPLARIIARLRQVRPDVHLCLEMLSRDPLKVPYREDAYWVPFGGRNQARIDQFKSQVLPKAAAGPLPQLSGLSPEQMLAREDENIRRSTAYAKQKLKI